MSVQNLTAEKQIYDASVEKHSLFDINMFCVFLKTKIQMPNPKQGQICKEMSSNVLNLSRIFVCTIFDPGRDAGFSLSPESKNESHQ